MASKRKSAKPPAEPKVAWDRDQFSVRLTAARRARLRLISDAMPQGSTPGDAVDRAVEIALSNSVAPPLDARLLGRLDDLEDLFTRASRERESSEARLRNLASQNFREIRALATLIASVAAMPSDDTVDVDVPKNPTGAAAVCVVPTLRTWLDVKSSNDVVVECVARWQSMTRLDERTVALQWDMQIVGQAATRSIVCIGHISESNQLCDVRLTRALTLVCCRAALGGWEISARQLKPDRSEGDFVGRFVV